MNHYELKEFAKSLGLEVEHDWYEDLSRRIKVESVTFRLPPVFSPANGYERGDLIARLEFNDLMGPTEYADAIGPAYNALKQFELWR